MSMEYVYKASIVFKKIEEGIYVVYKSKHSSVKKGRYVSTDYVIDTLNRVDKAALLNNRECVLHAHFKLEETGPLSAAW